MKKNTASQLFGTFLPYPIINSVTLESGGSYNVSKDPHLLDVSLSPSDPGYMSSPAYAPPASGLKVNLKVAVRDVLDTAGMTSFFDKQDVLELLDMVIIQSTNAVMTSTLTGLMWWSTPTSGLEYYIRQYYTQGYTPPGVEFQKQTLNFNESADFTTQINGNNVIEKSYNFDFQLPTDSPAHLSYICAVMIDDMALANKYDINLTDLDEFWTSGTFQDYLESTHKVIIDGGSTVNTEHGYYLPNGQKWHGPVHYHNGTWMAGKKHTEAGHPSLIKKMTSSTAVIKDFRDFTDLPLTKGDFYNDQNNLSSLISTPFGKEFSDVIVGPKKSSVIYDTISYSTPYKSNNKTLSKVGLVFGLDMAEIQKQYSLLKTLQIHTKIKTFSVFRTNLETLSSPEIVVSSAPPGAYLQEIHGSPSHYSFFHIPDIVEPGNYEYYIELVLDKQQEINYINGVLTKLQSIVSNLGGYYKLATRNITLSESTLNNKTEIVSNESPGSRRNYVTPFNSVTGKFRPEYKNSQLVIDGYNIISNDLMPLKFWAETLYEPTSASLKKILLEKAVNPETGTPDGILMVKKIAENILQDWGRIFGGTKELASNGVTSYSGETGLTHYPIKTRTPEKRIIKLKSKLEVKDKLDYGYDYLPKYNNFQGMRIYSQAQFDAAIMAEYKKYFSDLPDFSGYTTTKGILPNPFSHNEGHTTFSPYKTKAGNIKISPQSTPADVENCMLSILDRNLSGVEANNKKLNYLENQSFPGIVSPQEFSKKINSSKQLEEIFSTEGISILPNNPFETNKLYTTTNQEEKGNYTFVPEDQPTDSINYNGKLIENMDSRVILTNMIRVLDTNYSRLKSINFYSLKDITVSSFDITDNQGPAFGEAELPLDNDSIIKAFKQKATLVDVSWLDPYLTPFDPDPIADTWLTPGQPGYAEYMAAQLAAQAAEEIAWKEAQKTAMIAAMKAHVNKEVDQLIKETPLQTLSLLAGSVPPASDLAGGVASAGFVNQSTNPFSPTNGQSDDPRKDFESGYASQWFNFDNLVRVEYLSGFNQGILNPQWKNIKGAWIPSSTILCRLVKYENDMINIKRPEVLELPIYNEYFLIKTDPEGNLGMTATPQPAQTAATQPAAQVDVPFHITMPDGKGVITGQAELIYKKPTEVTTIVPGGATPGTDGQGGILPVKTGQAVPMSGIYKIGSKL